MQADCKSVGKKFSSFRSMKTKISLKTPENRMLQCNQNSQNFYRVKATFFFTTQTFPC